MDVAQNTMPLQGRLTERVIMVINTNLSAQNAATLLMQSQSNLNASLQRLSSGSKITSPADDSAGLAVSMKLNAQMSRIDAATNNVNNAISFSQTQDGYVQQVNSAFSRMSELTVLAQDVTKATSDRALYQQEFKSLGSYINDVATKSFNGVSLFNGSTLSVTTDSDGNTFSNLGVNLKATSYTTATADDISSLSGAQKALGDVKNAISQLASDRANVGTNIESMTYYNNQLGTLKN